MVPRAEMLGELMRFRYSDRGRGHARQDDYDEPRRQHPRRRRAGSDVRHRRSPEERGQQCRASAPATISWRKRTRATRRSRTCSRSIAIVTNIDNDHLVTHEGDFERLKQSFVEFLHNLPFYGLAVVCSDDEHVRSILDRIGRPVVTYGLQEGVDLRAVNIRPRGLQTDYQVVRASGAPFDVTVNLPGTHNVLNSLAAIGVALELGIDAKAIGRALANFQGIDRRLQHIADVDTTGRSSVTIVDDYGHHPTEVAATLQALRQGYAGRRLVLAFQPHRYTRTRDLIDDFGKVLSAADALLVTEVYAAGEAPIAGADGRAICRAVRSRGQVEPVFVEKAEELAAALTDVIRDGDVIVTMGAGHISAVSHALPAQLADKGTP